MGCRDWNYGVSDNWKSLVEAGNLAFEQGRVAEAEQKFLDALKEAEKFGEDDSRLSLSLNNLAAIYHTQGKYTMAEPLYTRALAIKQKAHEGDHSEIALNLHNLAVLYSARRMYPVAEKHYKEALEMKERLFGTDSKELLNTLKYYAQLLKVLNRPVELALMEARIKSISGGEAETPEAVQQKEEA
jgi:tetratricopeptide (TPR) repeat protein